MRVLVCGGRNYVDRQALYHALDELHRLRKFELLIVGGARGADTLAEEWTAISRQKSIMRIGSSAGRPAPFEISACSTKAAHS